MSRQAPRHIPTVVGGNIRLGRLANDLTQGDLARVLGVDAFQVSRWERGLHRPSDDTLFAIADALGRDFVWFFSPQAQAA